MLHQFPIKKTFWNFDRGISNSDADWFCSDWLAKVYVSPLPRVRPKRRSAPRRGASNSSCSFITPCSKELFGLLLNVYSVVGYLLYTVLNTLFTAIMDLFSAYRRTPLRCHHISIFLLVTIAVASYHQQIKITWKLQTLECHVPWIALSYGIFFKASFNLYSIWFKHLTFSIMILGILLTKYWIH